MVPMHARKRKDATHEPERRAPPRHVAIQAYHRAEAVLGAPMFRRFMVAMRGQRTVEARHAWFVYHSLPATKERGERVGERGDPQKGTHLPNPLPLCGGAGGDSARPFRASRRDPGSEKSLPEILVASAPQTTPARRSSTN